MKPEEEPRMNADEHGSKNNIRHKLLSVFIRSHPWFLLPLGSTEYYVEGTLFPWTMSDFSLIDAIECGIVRLPRVPLAENIPGSEMPMFRNLWESLKNQKVSLLKAGRNKATDLDLLKLPVLLQTKHPADRQRAAGIW